MNEESALCFNLVNILCVLVRSGIDDVYIDQELYSHFVDSDMSPAMSPTGEI